MVRIDIREVHSITSRGSSKDIYQSVHVGAHFPVDLNSEQRSQPLIFRETLGREEFLCPEKPVRETGMTPGGARGRGSTFAFYFARSIGRTWQEIAMFSLDIFVIDASA